MSSEIEILRDRCKVALDGNNLYCMIYKVDCLCPSSLTQEEGNTCPHMCVLSYCLYSLPFYLSPCFCIFCLLQLCYGFLCMNSAETVSFLIPKGPVRKCTTQHQCLVGWVVLIWGRKHQWKRYIFIDSFILHKYHIQHIICPRHRSDASDAEMKNINQGLGPLSIVQEAE